MSAAGKSASCWVSSDCSHPCHELTEARALPLQQGMEEQVPALLGPRAHKSRSAHARPNCSSIGALRKVRLLMCWTGMGPID